MKFLIDTSKKKLKTLMPRPLVGGQLLTPLTQYGNAGEVFAIDNGAFSGFNEKRFRSMLEANAEKMGKCLFVVCPDIVGDSRRTMELWRRRHRWIKEGSGWQPAFVAQDGCEDMDIPWDEMGALFIGGMDPWKDSKCVVDLVKTAKTLGKHVHIGRVNTASRYLAFAKIGADTCDGSGIAKYDHMLKDIEAAVSAPEQPDLFDDGLAGNLSILAHRRANG